MAELYGLYMAVILAYKSWDDPGDPESTGI